MKYYLLFCLIAVAACKKSNDVNSAITVSNMQVQNDETAALMAKISFTLSRHSGVTLVYTDKRTGEVKEAKSGREERNHTIQLYELNENTGYEYYLKYPDGDGKGETTSSKFSFTTASIPSSIKTFYKQDENVISEAAPAHFMFTSRMAPSSILIVNNTGKLVWYKAFRHMLKVVRFTKNNTFLCLIDENNTPFGDGNVILEMSLAGDTLFLLKQGMKGFTRSVHHDLQLSSRGHILAVTNVYPTDGGKVPGDGILELDRNGNKVWEWTTFDTPDAAAMNATNQPWINSLVIDTDNNYLISLRTFSQVWKVNAQSGAVMWKLGKGGDVMMDAAGHFQFQHYAHRNNDGDVMLFDNGSATRPATRLLSFTIDEQQKKAVTKLNVPLPSHLYSAIMGSTMQLPDKQLLSASSTNNRIVKTDLSGNVLWALKVAEPIYRGEYIGNPFTNP